MRTNWPESWVRDDKNEYELTEQWGRIDQWERNDQIDENELTEMRLNWLEFELT